MEDTLNLRKKFIEDAIKTATDDVAFGLQRNLEQFLLAMEKRMGMSNESPWGKDDKNIIVIKLACIHDHLYRANFKLQEVSWAKREKLADTDFPEHEIDLLEPTIPGLLTDEQKPKVERNKINHASLEYKLKPYEIEIIKTCDALGCRYYRPSCNDALPNYRQCVDVYDNGNWKTVVVPEKQYDEIMSSAADYGNIVYDRISNELLNESVRKLLMNGIAVCRYAIGDDGSLMSQDFMLDDDDNVMVDGWKTSCVEKPEYFSMGGGIIANFSALA